MHDRPTRDATWHDVKTADIDTDPTEQAPRGGALEVGASLGRQLLRQRMFPGETGGTTIGRYVILRFVGAGGMGQVFAAYDPVLDRKVAIKLLPVEFGGDLEQRTRLLREAQALAKLSHPNVVQVYEAGKYEGGVYVAMEFVEGQTLRAWLDGGESGEGARPRARAILDKFIQAGRGLAAAHAAGLVHRDFKPTNVLVDTEGCARVLDFGLVSGVDGSSEVRPVHAEREHVRALDVELTTTGTMLGTPAYMAPEQFSGGSIDARADQFGFCVALFEALTGSRPFAGRTALEVMTDIGEGERDPTVSTRGLSRRVARVLGRGLSLSPDQRWPSMATLLEALEPVSSWRIAGAVAAVVIPLVGVAGWQLIAGYEQELDASAEQTEAEAKRADRAAFEREVIDDARRAAEVGTLARSPGRELEAIALGVEVLSEYGPDREDAPEPAVHGLAAALDGMVGVATLDRPDRLIASARLSPDGSLLVTTPAQPASGHGELELWSTEPARKLGTIGLGELDVGRRAPAISSDNRLLAVSSDRRCVVFDVGSREPVLQIDDCSEPAFAIDGRSFVAKVACGAEDDRHSCAIAAWSVEGGEPRWSTPIPSREFAFIVHPDGERLIVRHDHSLEESIEVLSVITGERQGLLARPQAQPRTYKQPAFVAEHVTLSGDGRKLAAVETDGSGRIVMWDLESSTPAVLDVDPTAWGWAFSRPLLSHAGDSLLIHGAGAGLTLYDPAADKPIYSQTWGGSQGVALPSGWLAISTNEWVELPRQYSRQAALGAEQLVASTDGRFVASVSGSGSRLWSAEEHFVLDRWIGPAGESIRGFTSNQIVTHDTQGVFRVYPREGEPVATLVDSEHVGMRLLTVATDRPSRVVFSVDGQFEVHELGSAQALCRIATTAKNWALGSDGQRFAVLGDDHRIRVWDVGSCSEKASFEVPEGKTSSLRFAADGSLGLRTSLGLNVIIDNQGRKSRIDEGCTIEEAGYSRLSPDGRLLLTCCSGVAPEHNPGRLWDVQSGEIIREFDLRGYNMAGQFSSDGRWLLYNAGQREVAVLGIADGRELFRVPGRIGFNDLARTREDGGLVLDLVGVGANARLVTVPLSVSGLVDAGCRVLERSELAERTVERCRGG